MKALIICPAERPNVEHLAGSTPLALASVCGKPFIFYWLEHLAGKGAKEIRILASDRPEQVREHVGDGSRWGVNIDVLPECRELTVREARKKYRRVDEADWIAEPCDVVLAGYLPGLPEHNCFESYSEFFSALQKLKPQTATVNRIGMREIKAGVWADVRAQISPTARLIAPCWIAENVIIGNDAIVGPGAIIENGCVIDDFAAVVHSYVAPETYVGQFTTLKHCLAVENNLINWQQNFHTSITDNFLLCALGQRRGKSGSANIFGRVAAAIVLAVTAPIALLWAIPRMFASRNLLRLREAILQNGSVIQYAEFEECSALWRRWPQLWNIIRGEFSWVGNRPLSRAQAFELTNEFERMWLKAPVGLFSYADALGCVRYFSDEARAHASFYAAQTNWRLNLFILANAPCKLVDAKRDSQISYEEQRLDAGKAALTETRVQPLGVPYSR